MLFVLLWDTGWLHSEISTQCTLNIVLSTRQMFVFPSEDPVLVHSQGFFRNIKLLINMCTRRFSLNLSLEIQLSPGIAFILTEFLFLEPSNSALLWPLIYQYSWKKEQQWWPSIEKEKCRHRVLVRLTALCLFTSFSCSSSLPLINIPSSLVKAKLLLSFLWNSITESYLKLALSSRCFAIFELQKEVLELLHFSQPGNMKWTGCSLSSDS